MLLYLEVDTDVAIRRAHEERGQRWLAEHAATFTTSVTVVATVALRLPVHAMSPAVGPAQETKEVSHHDPTQRGLHPRAEIGRDKETGPTPTRECIRRP